MREKSKIKEKKFKKFLRKKKNMIEFSFQVYIFNFTWLCLLNYDENSFHFHGMLNCFKRYISILGNYDGYLITCRNLLIGNRKVIGENVYGTKQLKGKLCIDIQKLVKFVSILVTNI